MGTYLFTWSNPAKEVIVTGDFDNWARTIKLEKKGDRFEKLVELSNPDTKHFYKYFVDGNWQLDDFAPKENDGHNNLNNVLTSDHISKKSQTHSPAAAIMSGIAPNSTTAALADKVPKEPGHDSENATISSAAPSSTTAQLAKDVPLEKHAANNMPGEFPLTPQSEPAAFSVNPIPATSGIGNPVKLEPGAKVPSPHTLTDNTISSTVEKEATLRTKSEAETFGVNPLPATAGVGNPIHLKPGEKVPDPSTFTSNTVKSTARTDEHSFNNAADLSAASASAGSKGPGSGTEAALFDLPPVSKTTIPESSLPMGSGVQAPYDKQPVTVSSISPQSTTAGLAAGVPLEPKVAAADVPETVKKSQEAAHVSPEASASPEAVKEKALTEEQLKKEIVPDPASSEGGISSGKVAGTAAGGAAVIGGAALVAAHGSKDTKSSDETAVGSHTKGVPAVVEKSMDQAHQSHEAASNEAAVVSKKAAEKELLKEVKPVQSSGEPGPTVTAAASEKAPEPTPTKAKVDSRDISPMSRPHEETSAAAIATPASSKPVDTGSSSTGPTKAVEESPASSPGDRKKKNRLSFFDKLKSKIHHK